MHAPSPGAEPIFLVLCQARVGFQQQVLPVAPAAGLVHDPNGRAFGYLLEEILDVLGVSRMQP